MDYEQMRDGLNMAVPFARHAHVEVTELSGAGARAALPEKPELLNHVGSQHAGALYTLGEAASGAAMVAAFGDLMGSTMSLVREASIRYLKVARGPIAASASLAEPAADVRARLDADGRTDFAVQVSLADGGGVEVATMTARWHMRKLG